MILQADAEHLPLADHCVDAVISSPPYLEARTYEDGLPDGYTVSRPLNEWIEWMLRVTREACRVSKGLVLWVVAGSTKDWCYQPGPEGLLYRWVANGGTAWRPLYWRRYGIPGSGGRSWFRADVEYVLAFVPAGVDPRDIWTDNLAMGSPAVYARPGGAMSNRTKDGQRRNARTGCRLDDPWKTASRGGGVGGRRKNGAKKCGTSRRPNGDRKQESYRVPAIANPGTLIDTGVAGGGHLGSPLAHENEAPYPEKLAEHLLLSVVPPKGIVLDPFSGSGTTAAVAKRHGRRFVASDLRESQCVLTRRRLSEIQKDLFSTAEVSS